MLLHGEGKEGQSQAVIEGCAQGAEKAHMGPIRGSVNGVEYKATYWGFRMVKGAMRTLTQNKQTVGAAGRDPHGAC